MSGGRDEYYKAVGGGGAATTGLAGATSCVPNDWPYGRLDTESSRGIDPAYNQAPPLFFDIQGLATLFLLKALAAPAALRR